MLGAQIAFTGGDRAGAEQSLKEAISRDPSHLAAYTMLGELYAREQRLDEARTQFEKVAAADPKSVAAPTMLGLIFEAQNRPDEARRKYERILETVPDAPVAANNLAWLYAERGEQLDLALELAYRAQKRLPSEGVVSDTIGWIYYKKFQPDRAVPFLQEGVDRDPRDPVRQYHLGMAYLQKGDEEQARRWLERALKLQPDFQGADDAKKALGSIKS